MDSAKEMPGVYAMAVACGQIGPHSESVPESVAVLIRVLDSRYQFARVGAAEALGKLGRSAAPAVQKLGALASDAST
jgi:hypothetical protein